LLHREGLVQARRLRRRTPPYSEPLAHAAAPNQLWCADFKGWFVCGNGERCDPLTISDAFSRYLLRCRAVEKTDGVHVRGIFEAVFRECGLPEAIRTDNGPPFAGPAPAGLSRLGMWWLRLGIRHERIAPGHPEQNGRHERMHQTLKQETAMPPASSLRRQQESFICFEREYNQQRPHEALGNQTPASCWVASTRGYPPRLPEPEFPETCRLRKVGESGLMKWKNRPVFLSKVLSGEHGTVAHSRGLLRGLLRTASIGLVGRKGKLLRGRRWRGAQPKAEPQTAMSQRPAPFSLPIDYAERAGVVKGSLRRAKSGRALDNPRPFREDRLIKGKEGSWTLCRFDGPDFQIRNVVNDVAGLNCQ